jgi:hypothetical protein
MNTVVIVAAARKLFADLVVLCLKEIIMVLVVHWQAVSTCLSAISAEIGREQTSRALL